MGTGTATLQNSESQEHVLGVHAVGTDKPWQPPSDVRVTHYNDLESSLSEEAEEYPSRPRLPPTRRPLR